MRWIAGSLLCALALIGCDAKRVFEDNVEFHDRGWPVNQPAHFTFQITDTTLRYDVSLTVRNTLDYPYARLFVNCDLRTADGASLTHQLTTCNLFDQKTGAPFGESGLGDIFDHRFPLLRGFAFRHPGNYQIEAQQYMRLDTISGILAVGLRVEKLDPKK